MISLRRQDPHGAGFYVWVHFSQQCSPRPALQRHRWRERNTELQETLDFCASLWFIRSTAGGEVGRNCFHPTRCHLLCGGSFLFFSVVITVCRSSLSLSLSLLVPLCCYFHVSHVGNSFFLHGFVESGRETLLLLFLLHLLFLPPSHPQKKKSIKFCTRPAVCVLSHCALALA